MKPFIQCLTLLLVSLGALHAAEFNVLFIMADDLRAELGCYGAKHIQSPNIDKLAARGTLFERAYCQMSVCNPSRSSLLGGVRPDTTGVLDNQHFLRPQLPDVVTLPQHFKNNGWRSISLGKIFHHSDREPGDDPESWSEPAWYHGVPDRSWFSKETDEKLKAIKKLPAGQRPKLVRGPPFEAANEPDDVYSDAQTAAKAIETLQRLKGTDKPFFLGVGFHKPHLPFTCPQKYWDLYPADTIKLPDNYPPPHCTTGTNSAPTVMCLLLAVFQTRWRSISFAVIAPAQASSMPKSAACSMNWTASACAKKRSSSSSVTMAIISARTASSPR
ncbi:MAG: hypothetical protein JWR15_2508 [Prosthecobacter sp.]|nr:hypothetical protein [Prosthecobacter sp.]